MRTLLRSIAIAIAVAGVADPALTRSRPAPIVVELVSGQSAAATAARAQLLARLGDAVTEGHTGHGEAMVVIDANVDPSAVRRNVPISIVTVPAARNLRLLSAEASPVRPGQQATLSLEVDVRDFAGRTSAITVTHNGAELGRLEHRWGASRRQRVVVPFVTVDAGTYPVRVAVAAADDEARRDDKAIDARIVTSDRPLRVAFVERRPSWSAGFVRRAAELDPAFEVASVISSSRGIDVRTGDAPRALTAGGLARFDVVAAGTPEELTTADLQALHGFMAERGGTVIFLPDRRPSGPYARFVSEVGFDEVLLATPVALISAGPRASEFALPKPGDRAMRPLASLPDGRTALAAWPVGEGVLVFSGALDGWRFRGDEGDRFSTFWRASLTAAALAAPPQMRVELDPAVVRPGGQSHVRVRLRQTEFARGPDGGAQLPAVRAVAIGSQGKATSHEAVRLWPTNEAGVFEGTFTPALPGTYYVHAMAGRTQHAVPVIESELADTPGADEEDAQLVTAATGGVVATTSDLAPVVNHLRSRTRGELPETVHPMRSGWWTLPFAAALSVEWTLRRRRGQR